MRLQNTTMAEDRVLSEIESKVNDVALIAERLDQELTEWQRAAALWDVNSPDDLAEKIKHLKKAQED